MTRRRRGPERAPAATPTPEDLYAHVRLIRRIVLRRGVPDREVDDVVQEAIISAVQSIEAGRFRPEPGVEPRVALRKWLVAVAAHHAAHKLDRAYMRREVLDANPLSLLRGWEEPPGATIELAEVLRVQGPWLDGDRQDPRRPRDHRSEPDPLRQGAASCAPRPRAEAAVKRARVQVHAEMWWPLCIPPPRPGTITAAEWWELIDAGYEVGINSEGYPFAKKRGKVWRHARKVLRRLRARRLQ